MKRLYHICLVLWAVCNIGCSTEQQSSSPPAPALTVVSWNLEWFPGKDDQTAARRMKEVHQALIEIDADIYLFQEMADFESVEQLVDGLPGYEVHVVSNFKYGNRPAKQQLAIVSRFPAHSAFAETFKTPEGSRAPPRGFSFAALED
ncbi:hypothetical protein P3T73_10075 [Kiritimatiellota bacterium B12222]|nr:hypothetical protein P3T73_10075 [Kiritimatiellota bacterium B12222]